MVLSNLFEAIFQPDRSFEISPFAAAFVDVFRQNAFNSFTFWEYLLYTLLVSPGSNSRLYNINGVLANISIAGILC